MLLRTYVSRKAIGRGRVLLEGVGLSSKAIAMCYSSHHDEEEAVQSGLMRWRDGEGASPTWAVLLEAMDYAELGVQHITALQQEVFKGTVHSQLVSAECTNDLSALSTVASCCSHPIPLNVWQHSTFTTVDMAQTTPNVSLSHCCS